MSCFSCAGSSSPECASQSCFSALLSGERRADAPAQCSPRHSSFFSSTQELVLSCSALLSGRGIKVMFQVLVPTWSRHRYQLFIVQKLYLTCFQRNFRAFMSNIQSAAIWGRGSQAEIIQRQTVILYAGDWCGLQLALSHQGKEPSFMTVFI